MLNDVVFITLVWLSFSIAVCTAFARLSTRQAIGAKPYDHLLSLSSLLLFLPACIMNTILALRYLRSSHFYGAGSGPTFHKLQFSSTTLHISCLWLVKASLLASYRSLVDSIRLLRLAWHFILGATIMAYITCFVGYPFAQAACGKSKTPSS